MKKKWNKAVNKAVMMTLTILGIGSSSMLFMACYGAPPMNYVEAEDSTLVVMEGDSVVASINLAEDAVEATDSAEAKE